MKYGPMNTSFVNKQCTLESVPLSARVGREVISTSGINTHVRADNRDEVYREDWWRLGIAQAHHLWD